MRGPSHIFASLAFLSLLAAPVSSTTAQPAEKLYSAEEIRADFVDLYARLQRAHFDLYARRSKDAYDRHFARMLRDIVGAETREDAAIRFQKFMAYGRVAHARIDESGAKFAAYRSGGGAIFPLRLRMIRGGAWIVDDCSGAGAKAPAGGELIAIDGVPFQALREKLAAHVSADTDYMMDSLLEYYFARLLWQEKGSPPAFSLRIKQNGRTRTIDVPARNQAAIAEACKASDRLDLDSTGRTAHLLQQRIAYLRPGPFYNNAPDANDMYENRSFAAFVDLAFGTFQTGKARALLIDLRDNPGGDSSFSDLMLCRFAKRPFAFASSYRIKVSPETVAANDQRLKVSIPSVARISAKYAEAFRAARLGEVIRFPVDVTQPCSGQRFDGPVYLLVNRASDSNTVFVAATVQDYKFGKILGEETSDLASTFGAMEQFGLKRTGIVVGYPKAEIIRPSGTAGRRGVVPDVAITTPIIERKDDPVLNAAVERIAKELR